MKKEVPIVMGFILGISIIAGVFITGVPWLTTWKNLLDEWFLVVQAWAVAVGVVNLTQIHSRRVSQKREGWFYSVWLIICMFGMIVFGVFIAKSPQNEGWRWMYNQLIAPMNATVYSTLVFYIGAAAYRAFRVRNLEATVLLVAAVILMLGRVPLGKVLLGGTWIEKTADWILNVPNSAGMRGIQLGATLGAIATALRILVGIERGHLGGTGE
ncbi:MAG TPA: hypothetical protein GXX30_01600 [Firmicutes bacterium]|nr:hypothetical protein [Candidatus Fermentithermobacillaceae bacterium]